MAKRVPRFKEVLMNERDSDTNDPLVWCQGDDGEKYVLQIDEKMLIPFALALLSEVERTTPSDQEALLAKFPAAEIATGLDDEGAPMIRFRLENSAYIGISLRREHLLPLREQIAQMEIIFQRETQQ